LKIVLTGATGFIGQHVLRELASLHSIVAVDRRPPVGVTEWAHADVLPAMLENQSFSADAIIHLGAHTDTMFGTQPPLAELQKAYLADNNTEYSKTLWSWCAKNEKKFIYASSAATYGDAECGFDDCQNLSFLKPPTPYAQSKHAFDRWAIKMTAGAFSPPSWAGLKFFNVYGPGEKSKGKMASMVFQAVQQAKQGRVSLFKSGEQKRDFVFVGDVVKVISFMLDKASPFGIYNVGTARARSFNDVASAAFAAVGQPVNIEYFDMPESLRQAYQAFTEAKINKLRGLGYVEPFIELEAGVAKVATEG
jgi:ADP-L-glycero-D-manno-heptose 6-epimerase